MSSSTISSTVSVELLDDSVCMTLEELSRACSAEATVIVELVQEGILTVQGGSPDDWRFAATELGRALTALRMQRDLGVNLAGAALALQLLDELRELRSRAGRRD